MRNVTLAAVVIAVSAVAPSIASGAPADKPIIVLESHVGSRPARLAPFLKAVNSLLETRGYAAFPASVLRIGGKNIPQPGILDPELNAASIAEAHSSAFAKYKAAQWTDALADLVAARDKTQRNPALVANDIGNHDLMFRTLVAIADCHKRLGDDKAAMAAMREVRRIYPTRPVSRADAWGPLGEQLYLAAMLEDRGILRGRLSVAAGDPNAQIAIEGQFRGVGNVSLADMLPGTYRVYIRVSALDVGRQYEVVVKAGDEIRYAADINLDKFLSASPEYVALTHASESTRKDECKLASHFAEAWTASAATLVLASGEENGRPIVTGIRCRDGVQSRRAIIFTDSEDYTTPEKLVPFLDEIKVLDPRLAATPELVTRFYNEAITTSQNAINRLEFNSFNKNQVQLGLGSAIQCVAGTFTARNNVMSENGSLTNMEQVGGTCAHVFSIARPGSLPAGAGNSAQDPLFANTTTGDLHIAAASPARDAADPASDLTGIASRDIDDEPRTSPADIGADQVP